MRSRRIDIAGIRREQIVEAAVQVINEGGLQSLSLSEVEKRAGMSRGQLTYYFPAKEDILLAVFDRLVLRMHDRIGEPCAANGKSVGGWEWVQHLLTRLLTSPPVSPEFGCLQYTFLAQLGHREDFRRRLANLYECWRSNMALGLAMDMDKNARARRVPPRAMASLVQALLHGLIVQRTADPGAFESGEVLELCLDMLGSYLGTETKPVSKRMARKKASVKARRRRALRQPTGHEVNGEQAHG
jgi:AcrR family transcriptional regulator